MATPGPPAALQTTTSSEPLTSPLSNMLSAHTAKSRVTNLNPEDEVFYENFSDAKRRRVRNKIDLRLMPVLCMLYLFAQLDRANIGNAKIEGLKEDTNMTDKQYSIVVAIFFVPYCLLEIPSNIVLKKFARPSIYLGILVMLWGVVMILHGFAKDFTMMAILRTILGVTEAGFYPAAMYLCTQWYRPHELALRFSLFTAVAAVAGIASGVLAAGIAKLDGLAGYDGWRWIFIVEGAGTVLAGAATWFFLIDTPARSTKWLDPEELRYLRIQNLIKEGCGADDADRFAIWNDFVAVVSCWRYWAFGFIFHAGAACGYGLKLTIPTIIRGLGYSRTQSQLLSTVPYIFAVITALITAFYSDRLARRSVFVMGSLLCVITGFGLVLGVASKPELSKPAMLVGLSLVTSGLYPIGPTSGSWVSNNIASSGRRAVGLAFVMTVGATGGLTGSFMYIETQAPRFPLGFGLSCGLAGGALLLASALVLSYWRENCKRNSMSEAGIKEKYAEEDLKQLGENSPLFRYTL